MVKPSSRKRMAVKAVKEKGISVRLACRAFKISEYCYRYHPKLNEKNELIADWLIRLTHNQKNWGFGLCFLYLRNVKGFKWNHKRVYRIYKELELNMRIKPKKRINDEFYKQYYKSYEFIGRLAIAVIGIRDGKQISYDDFCTVKIPYPSIADVFFVAGYIPYIFGLILYAIFLFKEFKIKVNIKEALTIHAVYLPVLAVSIYVLVSPWYEALIEGEDPIVLALDLVYILFDLIILAVSLYILLFIRGKVGVIFFLIALGGILIVFYDVLFTYLDTLELYYDGHPIELLDLYSYMTDAIAFYKAKEIL